ncbi:MAG TPA: NAD(P)-dependent oxidoreductase, partial [Nitrososphaerales archaeon]|nr:NAD(P)-dependent oxidoreductase [Nitrososphaerales archaeon]
MLKDFDLVNGSERREDVSKAEIILCWPTTLGGIVEFTGPNLKVIQPFSAGVDDLPYDKIPESVQIFSNAGAYSQSVAEHALALVLALSKNVGRKDPPESYEIARKTIVILGAGEIGSTVAKMMWDGFTCRTVGISRSFKHPENFDEVLSPSHLDDALGAADILICALPLN